ncbi:MAG: HD-GYP domain-containing protein [Gammaproteobacteria bacterium]
MQLNLHNIVCSLSSALDFVGIDDMYHGKRVALMAAGVAQVLHWNEVRQLDLLYAGMLHDCGVSTTGEHTRLVSELDWEDSQEHCFRGHRYLNECPLLAKYAVWVLYHHTHWQELQQLGLDEQDKLAANLLYLADRVDYLQLKYSVFESGSNGIFFERHRIIEEISQFSGTFFAPPLIDAFSRTAKKESFWLAMEPVYVTQSVQNYSDFSPLVSLQFEQIRSIAELFSRVIDAKSHYTEEHSQRVGVLARFLAEQFNFTPEEQQQIEIAGMLHDLGKLRIPDYILNKKGPLTEDENAYVLRHSFDTVQLLNSIFPHTKIAQWAGFHHESLSGNGYPFRLQGDEIDLGARIVAAADCFQALVQQRPYRNSLSLEQVAAVIENMVEIGKLDSMVVSAILDNREKCYELAGG